MLYDILFCLNIYGSYPLAVCTFCSVQLSCQDRNIDPSPYQMYRSINMLTITETAQMQMHDANLESNREKKNEN